MKFIKKIEKHKIHLVENMYFDSQTAMFEELTSDTHHIHESFGNGTGLAMIGRLAVDGKPIETVVFPAVIRCGYDPVDGQTVNSIEEIKALFLKSVNRAVQA